MSAAHTTERREPEGVAFGAVLRRLRRDAGLTQEQLAERAGVSNRTVSNLERGVFATPRGDSAILLADALGLRGRRRSDFFAIVDQQRPARSAAPPADAGAAAASLPPARTALLGRDGLLAGLEARLAYPDRRLVTLLGTGGVGKTRLALEAALRTAGAGRPVAWAPLEALGGPDGVLPAIARAVGAEGQPGEDPVVRIADAVAGRNLLLVLDNCEHVLEAASDISAVLAAAPTLRVLATSRALLRIDGERVLDVPPLPVPAADEDADRAAANPAVELFSSRAGLADAATALPDVRRVVTALDGIPLAIELAAAQHRAFSVAAIADLLDRAGIDVLDSGRRDAHDRLRSMDAAIRWSTNLLGPRERRLLRVLSVFRGGADLELLGETCDRLGEPRLLRALPALVEASLASERPEPDGTPRIHLLSPIRLFAEAELDAAGETQAVERAHRETMVGFARRAGDLIIGPNAIAGLVDLDRELDNLTAAIDRAIRAVDARDAVAIAASMGLLWEARSEVAEGFRWLERALALPDSGACARPDDILFAEQMAAYLAVHLGRHDRWREIVDRMLARATEAGDARGIGIAQHWLGDVAWYLDGDLDLARTMHERSVATLDPLGETIDLALACERLADFLIEHGEPAPGLELAQRAVGIRRACGNTLLLSASMIHAGTALAMLGRGEEARAPLREAAELSARFGNLVVAAYALLRLAAIDAASSDPACLSRAARLVGAADAWLERRHVVLDAAGSQSRQMTLDAVAASLGAAECARLLAEGHELTAEEALAIAAGG